MELFSFRKTLFGSHHYIAKGQLSKIFERTVAIFSYPLV